MRRQPGGRLEQRGGGSLLERQKECGEGEGSFWSPFLGGWR
jgi:hypothetical protein